MELFGSEVLTLNRCHERGQNPSTAPLSTPPTVALLPVGLCGANVPYVHCFPRSRACLLEAKAEGAAKETPAGAPASAPAAASGGKAHALNTAASVRKGRDKSDKCSSPTYEAAVEAGGVPRRGRRKPPLRSMLHRPATASTAGCKKSSAPQLFSSASDIPLDAPEEIQVVPAPRPPEGAAASAGAGALDALRLSIERGLNGLRRSGLKALGLSEKVEVLCA